MKKCILILLSIIIVSACAPKTKQIKKTTISHETRNETHEQKDKTADEYLKEAIAQKNNYKRAISILEQGSLLYKKNPILKYFLGVFYYKDKQIQKAANMFIDSVLLTKPYSSSRKTILRNIEKITSVMESKEDISKFHELRRYAAQRKFSEALAIGKDLLKRNPYNTHLFYKLGYILIDVRNIREAKKLFYFALNINPTSRKLLTEILFINNVERDTKAAEKTANIISLVHGISGGLFHELSYCFIRNNDLEKALSIVETGIKHFPNFAYLYKQKALIFLKMGKKKEAIRLLNLFTEKIKNKKIIRDRVFPGFNHESYLTRQKNQAFQWINKIQSEI